MSVPGITGALALVPALLLQRPWTIITYMFTHSTGGISHILFNMFALYIFGPRVEARLGGAHFIRLYLIAGVSRRAAVAVLHAVRGHRGCVRRRVRRAAGVRDVLPAATSIYIWGVLPIEARVLVIIMTLITLYGGFSGGSGVAHFAHLGGYVGAYLYLKWVERQAPSRKWQAKVAGRRRARSRPSATGRAWTSTRVHEVNRDEVSRILGKIERQGEGSLTSQERVFLGHFTPRDA